MNATQYSYISHHLFVSANIQLYHFQSNLVSWKVPHNKIICHNTKSLLSVILGVPVLKYPISAYLHQANICIYIQRFWMRFTNVKCLTGYLFRFDVIVIVYSIRFIAFTITSSFASLTGYSAPFSRSSASHGTATQRLIPGYPMVFC